MHELSDDDPIIRATSAITTGNIGRLNSAVASFQKRTDDLFKTIGALSARVATIEAEQPPRPLIYRSARSADLTHRT